MKPRIKTKYNKGNYKKKEKYTFSRAMSAKYYSQLSRKRNSVSWTYSKKKLEETNHLI